MGSCLQCPSFGGFGTTREEHGMRGRSAGGRYGARLTVTVFFALVMAAGLAVGWSPGEAVAQTTTTEPKLTAEDQRILQKIAEDTRAADAARARGEVPTASVEGLKPRPAAFSPVGRAPRT